MVKSNVLAISLAAAIFLTAQQVMLWSSRFLANDRREELSLSLDRPSNGGTRVQRRENNVMEQRADRLTEPPTNIYVVGERNSGTTFTAGGNLFCLVLCAVDNKLTFTFSTVSCLPVLKKAFDPPNKPDGTRPHESFSSDIPVLLHKHMFRHHLLNETELEMISMRTDILWLFAVRSPCEERIDGMQKCCFIELIHLLTCPFTSTNCRRVQIIIQSTTITVGRGNETNTLAHVPSEEHPKLPQQ